MALFEEVKEIEASIIETKKRLLDVCYRYHAQGQTDEVLRQQMQNCKEDVELLSRRLAALQSCMRKDEDHACAPAYESGKEKTAEGGKEHLAEPAEKRAPGPEAVLRVSPKNPAVHPLSDRPAKEKNLTKKQKNLEETLGKSVMGVLASALIFISFILFAALIYPMLTPTVKLVSMFGISGLFLGIGLWRLQKNPGHRLWLAVTGCGVGGIYLSLLLSHLYFHVIGPVALYGCLLVWCIGVCALARNKSLLFQIIGLFGVFISVGVGVFYCNVMQEMFIMVSLCIYTVAALLIFTVSHWDREHYAKNAPAVLTSVLSLSVLSLMNDMEPWFGTWLICALALVQLLYVVVKVKPTEKTIVTALAVAANVGLLWWNIATLLRYDSAACTVASLCLLALVLIAVESMNWNRRDYAYCLLVSAITLCIAIVFSAGYHGLDWKMPLLVVAVLYLVWARAASKGIYKWLALTLAVLSCWITLGGIPECILTVLFIAAWYVTEYIKKDDYSPIFVIAAYTISLLLIILSCGSLSFDYDWDMVLDFQVVVGCLGFFNLAALCTPALAHPVDRGQHSGIHSLCMAYNAMLMFTVWFCILICGGGWFIFLGFVLFSATTWELIQKESFAAAFYVGVKYTLLGIAIMQANDVNGGWNSLVFFVLALISVIAGFWLHKKGLRMYGLLLAMFSVAKLVLVDIDYGNSVMRAVSFFVCGMLCFAISFIYNRVDKKLGAPEETNQGTGAAGW